ncbi:MAG: DUF726 domain-containing protein [Thermoproteota archaeon]
MPARIPRISTRGFYDLATGRTLKKKPYDLYPKNFFENLGRYPELTIVVHGMRNNKQGALEKFKIAQRRLRKLGYKYPIIGFSYDSNVKGIQYKTYEFKATMVGKAIARKNSENLAKFILNFKKNNPKTRIRLIGHSLGTEVILHVLSKLRHRKNIVESAHFFGSSVGSAHIKKLGKSIQNALAWRLCNYYNPHDEILKHAHENRMVEKPIGYVGIQNNVFPKYTQKRVFAKNHRFSSYSVTMTSFP